MSGWQQPTKASPAPQWTVLPAAPLEDEGTPSEQDMRDELDSSTHSTPVPFSPRKRKGSGGAGKIGDPPKKSRLSIHTTEGSDGRLGAHSGGSSQAGPSSLSGSNARIAAERILRFSPPTQGDDHSAVSRKPFVRKHTQRRTESSARRGSASRSATQPFDFKPTAPRRPPELTSIKGKERARPRFPFHDGPQATSSKRNQPAIHSISTPMKSNAKRSPPPIGMSSSGPKEAGIGNTREIQTARAPQTKSIEVIVISDDDDNEPQAKEPSPVPLLRNARRAMTPTTIIDSDDEPAPPSFVAQSELKRQADILSPPRPSQQQLQIEGWTSTLSAPRHPSNQAEGRISALPLPRSNNRIDDNGAIVISSDSESDGHSSPPPATSSGGSDGDNDAALAGLEGPTKAPPELDDPMDIDHDIPVGKIPDTSHRPFSSPALEGIVPALNELEIASSSSAVVASVSNENSSASGSPIRLARARSPILPPTPVAQPHQRTAKRRVTLPENVNVRGTLYGGASGFFKNAIRDHRKTDLVRPSSLRNLRRTRPSLTQSSAEKSDDSLDEAPPQQELLQESNREAPQQTKTIAHPNASLPPMVTAEKFAPVPPIGSTNMAGHMALGARSPPLMDVIEKVLREKQQVIDLTLSDDESTHGDFDNAEEKQTNVTTVIGTEHNITVHMPDRSPRRVPTPRTVSSKSSNVDAGVPQLQEAYEALEVDTMLQNPTTSDDDDDQSVVEVALPRRSKRRLHRYSSPEDERQLPAPPSDRSSLSSGSSLPEPAVPSRLRQKRGPVIDPDLELFMNSFESLSAALDDIRLAGNKAEVWSWAEDKRVIAKEFADYYAAASDLPHMLEDEMNGSHPEASRTTDMHRKVFEAAIRFAEIGTSAPPIRIVNDIDDQLSPPFEFHYTNLMYHSNNVPKPDFDNLEGCDCPGRCNPNSTKCACVRRQREYLEGFKMPAGSGFIYNEMGRALVHGFPIFECNALCSCGDECRNRVVQHGRKVAVNIKKTLDKGWGVFAAEDIPANVFVGIYAGEYITDSEGEERGGVYNHFGRSYLFDLDFYYLKNDDSPDPKYCVDAYHAGNFTRYLNHSCDPNCQINPVYINEANIEKPLLTIFTKKFVKSGQELCFSYVGEMDDADFEDSTQAMQSDAVYIPCRCGAKKCTGRMWS